MRIPCVERLQSVERDAMAVGGHAKYAPSLELQNGVGVEAGDMGDQWAVALGSAAVKLTKAPVDEIRDLAQNKQKLLMLRSLRRAIDDLGTLAEVDL